MAKTILVVDDEPHMLRLLQFALRPVGADLALVRSGQEAISFMAEHEADLVILDYSMPGLDGVKTLESIRDRANRPDLPVVMLTARDQTVIRKAAAGLNVTAFITKPFSPSNLQRMAKELLGL